MEQVEGEVENDVNTLMCEHLDGAVAVAPHDSGDHVLPCSAQAQEQLPVLLSSSPLHGPKSPCPQAEKAEEAEMKAEFKVCIKRSFPLEGLGVQLDISDGRLLHLCALKTTSCPVASYNDQAPDREKLQVGDYIVQVNEITCNSRAMMKEVQSCMELQLTVRRPHNFSVEINKTGGPLGLGLNHVSKATSLVVEEVLPGPVLKWNDANPGLAIEKGDRIISVNGTSGQAKGTHELLRQIAETETLALELTRPAGAPLEGAEDKAVLSDAPRLRAASWGSR